MTLAALAKQLNTSTMTIYRRLKRNGVSIDELRDANTGDLTPAGVSMIAALFDGAGGTSAEQPAEQSVTPVAERDTTADALAVAVLEAKLEGAEALIEQLTGERDELRRQLAAALAALAAEQADRQQERHLLTGSTADPAAQEGESPRRGWLARLFVKR